MNENENLYPPMEILKDFAELKTGYYDVFRTWAAQAKQAGVPFLYVAAIQKDKMIERGILIHYILDYFQDMFMKEFPSDCGG